LRSNDASFDFFAEGVGDAIYSQLTNSDRKAIADKVCRIQQLVGTLPEGPGYGVVSLPVGPYLPSWRAVLDQHLADSRSRIEVAGLLSTRAVQRVERHAARFQRYFERVRPVPFLDDATTKNVLVHDGRLSGIVDVDEICFGDPLFTIGQTRASLLNSGLDSEYTNYWCDALDLTSEQRSVVALYTAMSCVIFLSEFGHRFNRDVTRVDATQVATLERLLDEHLAQAES